MNERTVKLSGHTKDRFLERFFGEEPGLDAPTRQRLVQRSQSAFSSLRVRKTVLARPRVPLKPATTPSAKLPEAQPAAPPTAPTAPPPAPTQHAATPALAPTATPAGPTPFDPYAFGLVPIFQREGAEGLTARLEAVTDVAHLRQMAKAQQIVLPQELRSGDAAADAIRAGIVEAVGKRIKDRRAAAG